MNRLFLVVIITFFSSKSFSQTAVSDSLPSYAKLGIPAFKLSAVPDSSTFTKDMLEKKEPTIIMVFSPDCGHCEHSTKDLVAHYDLFKKTRIVMATSLGYSPALKFYNELKIADYPAIKIGVDPSYFLGTFYQVTSYPAIFLYDKKGNFKKAFDANAKWEEIAKEL